jgi:hypothetical protein
MAIDEYREGDVPKGSPITVMSSIGHALIAFYGCRCGRRARFSPADMRRRNLDPQATLWSIATKLRCTGCGRTGDITHITRVRVSGGLPQDL